MTRRRPHRPTAEAVALAALAAVGAVLYALGVIPLGLAAFGGASLLLAVGALYGHDRLAAYTDDLERSARRVVGLLSETRDADPQKGRENAAHIAMRDEEGESV